MLSRRQALLSLSAFAVTTVTSHGRSDAQVFRTALSDKLELNPDLDQIIRSIFVQNGDLMGSEYSVNLRPANTNPNVETDPNKNGEEFTYATRQAASILCKSLYEDANDKRLVDSFIYTPPNQTEICFGSPTSNALARVVMGYESRDPSNDHGGALVIERTEQDLFKFPFVYELDRSRIMTLPSDNNGLVAECYRRQNGKKKKITNWGIAQGENLDHIELPEVDENNILTSDYLLITCVPNCFYTSSFDAGHRIFLIGGTHSEGTKAFKKVLRNEDILSEMSECMSRFPAWQAKIEVSEFENDEVGSIRKYEFAEVVLNYGDKFDRDRKITKIWTNMRKQYGMPVHI